MAVHPSRISTMAANVAISLLLILCFMPQVPALKILRPMPDDFLAPVEGKSFQLDVGIDLEGFRTPDDGVVSIFVDGAFWASLCPEKVGHVDDCPSEVGDSWSGVRTFKVPINDTGAHHSLVVHTIDFESLAVIEQASVSFYVRQTEDDIGVAGTDPNGPLVNMLMFSKDRACQLELLIRSMKEMAPGWEKNRLRVLYRHTTDDFKEGYRRLKRVNKDVEFVLQEEAGATFKEAVLATLDASVPYTMFFVDDQVFTAPFDFQNDTAFQVFTKDPKIMAVTLRMHPGVTYCYPNDQTVHVPNLSDDLVWDWRGAEGDWGYPMSVDAHIFRTKEILPLLQRLDYINPNEMEAFMHRNALPNPYLVCYPTPRVFNVPTNRVQNTFPNRHIHPYHGFSPEQLNTEFLMGRQVSMETLRGLTPRSPHVELPLLFGVGARPRNKLGEKKGEEVYLEGDEELLAIDNPNHDEL